MNLKSQKNIANRINILEKIQLNSIDDLKNQIPDDDFKNIKNAGEEWCLLLGYTTRAIDALNFASDKSQEVIIELFNQYELEFKNIAQGQINKNINPYIIAERYHVLAWILDKSKWGKYPDEII